MLVYHIHPVDDLVEKVCPILAAGIGHRFECAPYAFEVILNGQLRLCFIRSKLFALFLY